MISVSVSQSVSLSVCLSVCLWAYETIVQSLPTSCTRYLWPWLGLPSVALRYVLYFRFYGWRQICTHWPGTHVGNATKVYTKTGSTKGSRNLTARRILKLAHEGAAPNRGRSLMSATALFQKSNATSIGFMRYSGNSWDRFAFLRFFRLKCQKV